MQNFDDLLTRELERAGRPAAPDPQRVVEEVTRRRARRGVIRRVQAGALTVVVLAATTGGFVLLARFFGEVGGTFGEPSPQPIVSKTNGLLSWADGEMVFTISPSGGRSTPLSKLPRRAWLPSWSPDGSRIAVAVFPSGEREIWVANADGLERRRLAEANNVSQPSWSPDGTQIAFAADTSSRSAIHLINVDGSDDQVVGQELVGRNYFSVSFSPDGTKLLYDAGTDSGFGIFVMDVDGTGVRRLSERDQDYDPAWSPDGSHIAFTRQEEGAESDIFVMDADGSDVRRLTNDGPGTTNLNPTWAPDGTKLAFVAGVTGGPGGLVVMNLDGSGREILVDEGVLGIAWQPIPEASLTPEPNEGRAEGRDIGLGFPVCNVSSIREDFDGDDAIDTAFTATRRSDTGSCPQVEEAFNVIAMDLDDDGLADVSYGPIVCELECRTFAAPDLDADDSAELLVVESGGSVPGMRVYDLVRANPGNDVLGIAPIEVGEPDDPRGGFSSGESPILSLGGDGFAHFSLRCRPWNETPALVITSATQEPPDSTDSVWRAHETWFVLKEERLEVVDTRDFEEPFTAEAPSFQSGEELCGSKLGP